jgi:hypothetical protein
MANKDKKNIIRDERAEDTTLYGEFISSFDQWMTIDNQRKRAKHMEEMTEQAKNQKK